VTEMVPGMTLEKLQTADRAEAAIGLQLAGGWRARSSRGPRGVGATAAYTIERPNGDGRHARPCAGHPRLSSWIRVKTLVAGDIGERKRRRPSDGYARP